MASLLVLHGPNLNLLGTREPSHYGNRSLAEVNALLKSVGDRHGVAIECRQSNAEHELVEWIQGAPDAGVGFVVINPAAFTHTSVAIRDAFAAVGVPFVEVHLSNVHRREPFRKHSYLSDIAEGVIAGMGPAGYELACRFGCEHLLAD